MKKISFRKTMFYLVCVLVLLSFFTHSVSYAKYASSALFNYYLSSKGFYFESDKLKMNGANNVDTHWDGKKIYFNLTNQKNNYVTSYDIEYNALCTIVEDENKVCELNGTDSNKYSGTLTVDYGCFNKNGDKDVTSFDEKTCLENGYEWTVRPSNTSLYFEVFDLEGNEVDNAKVNVTVTSTKPYVKTISSDFVLIRSLLLTGQVYHKYVPGTVFDSVIISNSYKLSKCISLSWDSTKYVLKNDDYTVTNDDNNYKSILLNIPEFESKKINFYKLKADEEYLENDFKIIESDSCSNN